MIPRVEDVASDRMVHRFGELFNPPGLTNFLGCVQAELDPVAIRSLSFPPLACSDVGTGWLYLDGRLFAADGDPISFRWRPDCIERETRRGTLTIRTRTTLTVGRTAAVVLIEVSDEGGGPREVELRLGLRGAIGRSVSPWRTPLPPVDFSPSTAVDGARGAVVFTERTSGAAAVHGASPRPDAVDEQGLTFRLSLSGGRPARIAFVHAVADDAAAALALFDEVAANPERELERARADWDEELRAIFTPGNDRYGGSLPVLETSDESLRRLYLTGILGVVVFKRETPHSVIGRTYDTLMPRYWQTVTFLWDYGLSATVHALLDPGVMRRHMEFWMAADVHQHVGTEWLTGQGVGPWYSANDYSMLRMAREYLRWNGDDGWTTRTVRTGDGSSRSVLEMLSGYATHYRALRTGSGLADYGGIDNLLECVSTYVHEVAALNAANVWGLRFVAEMQEAAGDATRGKELRAEAEELLEALRPLYVEGGGHWAARQPDGSLVPVRQCYDLITILNTIAEDLAPRQREEMTEHFRSELMTPTWMRALSPADPDAVFSVRPDHQWTGAYTAWPAQALTGLFRIGQEDLAGEWLRGLGATANQGPFGQAHLVAPYPEEQGGALKSPSDQPWICDWACSSGGAWVTTVLEGVFGVDPSIDGTIDARPRLAAVDPDARLTGLQYRGRSFSVDAAGVREE